MPSSSARSRWIATASSSISTRLTPSPACATRSNPPPRKLRTAGLWPACGPEARGPNWLAHRVVDEIVGEIGRLQLEVEPVAVAGQGARHKDVVLDLLGAQP